MDISINSLLKYIGHTIIFGIFHFPQLQDYWTTKDYIFEYKNKDKGLSRDTFLLYHSNMVVDENLFLELLNETFQSHVSPGTNILSKYTHWCLYIS